MVSGISLTVSTNIVPFTFSTLLLTILRLVLSRAEYNLSIVRGKNTKYK